MNVRFKEGLADAVLIVWHVVLIAAGVAVLAGMVRLVLIFYGH